MFNFITLWSECYHTYMEKVSTLFFVGLIGIAAIFRPPELLNPAESVYLFFRDQIMRLIRPKYFHNDRVDFKPVPFEQVLANTTHDTEQQINQWTITIHYQGEDRETKVSLLNKFDPAKPSFIYHHGAGDTNPMKDFNMVFGKKYSSSFNTFIIHAAHHASRKDYLLHSVDSFLHHQLTFAGSVVAVEEIVRYHQHHSDQKIISTGVSMGGIVSSLHAFYFNTADYYFPLVAYPNVGEIFISPAYKTVTKEWEKKRKIVEYPQSFEIGEFDPTLRRKIFPVLGSFDQIVAFEQANNFWMSRGFEVKVLPYGHFTPGFAAKEIRQYITQKSSL